MTTAAQNIIQRAQTALFDPQGIRWSAKELVNHLNDGQVAVVIARPDANAQTVSVTLQEGVQQVIPDNAMALIDIPANATGARKRITKITMELLDAVAPSWRTESPAEEIKHFMFDMRFPRLYRVYPPATGTAQVEMTHSVYPAKVADPSGDAWTAVTGNIALVDYWADALFNFVMFKAYSKDAEFGGNSQLAASYFGMFNAALGQQAQSSASVAPQQ